MGWNIFGMKKYKEQKRREEEQKRREEECAREWANEEIARRRMQERLDEQHRKHAIAVAESEQRAYCVFHGIRPPIPRESGQ